MPPMFYGLGLRTSSAFDAAYQAPEKFFRALSKRRKSAGFHAELDATAARQVAVRLAYRLLASPSGYPDDER